MDELPLEEAAVEVQLHISRGKSREATLCTSGEEEFQFKNRHSQIEGKLIQESRRLDKSRMTLHKK